MNDTKLKSHDRNELAVYEKESKNKHLNEYRLREIQPILDHIKQKEPVAILEACCGIGTYTTQISKLTHMGIMAFDINKDYIKNAIRDEIIFYYVDDAITLKKTGYHQYDLIYMIDGLHHITEPMEAIKSMLTKLKKGGTLLIIDRNDSHPFIYITNRIYEPKTIRINELFLKMLMIKFSMDSLVMIGKYCHVTVNVLLAKLFNNKKEISKLNCLRNVRTIIKIRK